MHLWQGAQEAARESTSTNSRTAAPARNRPRVQNHTEATLATAEAAAKRIESKKKQNANKAQKQWYVHFRPVVSVEIVCICGRRTLLVRQWVKLHGCSNEALKQYDRWVRTTTAAKRSIHLYLAPLGVPMSRVRLPPCVLQLYPLALTLGPVCAGYIRLCPRGRRLLDGYIRSFQIAANVPLLSSVMHEMTKNLRKTVLNKIAKRMLPMAVRLVRLWFEHADVEQTVEPFEDQVQQL